MLFHVNICTLIEKFSELCVPVEFLNDFVKINSVCLVVCNAVFHEISGYRLSVGILHHTSCLVVSDLNQSVCCSGSGNFEKVSHPVNNIFVCNAFRISFIIFKQFCCLKRCLKQQHSDSRCHMVCLIFDPI